MQNFGMAEKTKEFGATGNEIYHGNLAEGEISLLIHAKILVINSRKSQEYDREIS